MQTAARRRTILGHRRLGRWRTWSCCAVALLQRPTLTIPVELAGPPEAMIPVLILPRAPRPAGRPTGSARADPAAPPRPANPTAETPFAPADRPRPPKPASRQRQARRPPRAEAGAARRPARRGRRACARRCAATLGCSGARLAGLSREDAPDCLERLGRGAPASALLGAGACRRRASAPLLDQAGAAKLARRTPPSGTASAPLRYGQEAGRQDYRRRAATPAAAAMRLGPVALTRPASAAAHGAGPPPPAIAALTAATKSPRVRLPVRRRLARDDARMQTANAAERPGPSRPRSSRTWRCWRRAGCCSSRCC